MSTNTTQIPAPLNSLTPSETPAVAAPAHHKFGPSSHKNREICPGWKNDQDSDKSAANEGTLMHLSTETGNLSGLTEEQAAQVTKCINYVAGLLRKGTVIEDRKEARLTILGGRTFGTTDRLILIRRPNGKLHIDVVDYKMGWNSVDDASENRQGFNYVLGAADLPGLWQEAETISVHLLLPRRDEVSKHTFTRADLPRLGLIISNILARAEHWSATRDASMLQLNEVNCTYCGRKATCPVMMNYGIAHAKKYAPLEIADEVHSSQITDPAAMAKFFIALKVLEKMVDSGKKHVAEFAKENDLPGFVRRERKGKVTITNSVAAWPQLLKALDITSLESPALVDLINTATFSYTDIVAAVSAKAGKGKPKTEALGKLWTSLQDADCVYEADSTPYLQRVKEDLPIEVAATPVPLPEPAVATTSRVTGPAVE